MQPPKRSPPGVSSFRMSEASAMACDFCATAFRPQLGSLASRITLTRSSTARLTLVSTWSVVPS